MGEDDICLCVAVFLHGEGNTQQNSQEISGKCLHSPGIIRDNLLCIFSPQNASCVCALVIRIARPESLAIWHRTQSHRRPDRSEKPNRRQTASLDFKNMLFFGIAGQHRRIFAGAFCYGGLSASPKPHPSKPHPCNMPQAKKKKLHCNFWHLRTQTSLAKEKGIKAQLSCESWKCRLLLGAKNHEW